MAKTACDSHDSTGTATGASNAVNPEGSIGSDDPFQACDASDRPAVCDLIPRPRFIQDQGNIEIGIVVLKTSFGIVRPFGSRSGCRMTIYDCGHDLCPLSGRGTKKARRFLDGLVIQVPIKLEA